MKLYNAALQKSRLFENKVLAKKDVKEKTILTLTSYVNLQRKHELNIFYTKSKL